ncbi:hypothetical protein [Oceanithermus sp.]
MSAKIQPALARETIRAVLPEDTSLHGAAPEPRFVHLPPSHTKALDPDAQVVVGMRGAGKSFWWAALQDERLRRLIAVRSHTLQAVERAKIYVGFGETPAPNRYPGRDTLRGLLNDEYEPRLVWRTVVLHALSHGDARVVGTGSDWASRVAYVQAHPEAAERFLYDLDLRLDHEGRYALVLFDALDRSAPDWPTMHLLIRGLLENALDLRPYRRLRLKCFLRSDQLDERSVADFPDASKMFATRVELSWPHRELYAMLFQYLGNAEDGAFRQEIEKHFGYSWDKADDEHEGIFLPPKPLLRDEGAQKEVFHAITGPWMGRDRRRGFPYTWVPGHLADAHGRTSPRSFLAALRAAAEDTDDRYPDHDYALHYESIKRGVQHASRIRRSELREDYPWVDALLEPLEGMVVPIAFDEIESVWRERSVISKLKRGSLGGEHLPPAHLEEGGAGLRRDLEDLGIFLRMRDGRVNIPDVFRVAYGLGRRGGVRPLGSTGAR